MPSTSASGQPAAKVQGRLLSSSTRSLVKRLHAGVLLFYLVDAVLLTGYGLAGTISIHVGWVYGLSGCLLAGIAIAWFWRRGGRVADLEVGSLAQTLAAAAVMWTTLGAAPQVGAMMLISMMAVLALSAVQLNGRHLVALCLLLPIVAVAVLIGTDSSAAVPTTGLAERALTGVWLAWLMAKASAHNVAGSRLRSMVSEANDRLATALRELEVTASTDELTVLPNRRSILEHLRRALAAEEPSGRRVGVALLDIDEFKSVNDRHGHAIGDQVLRAFAQRVSGSLRPTDRVGRYGGEEFLLVLQQMPDADAAMATAERVRSAVQSHDWSTVAPGLAVTVSIGVALVQPDDDGAEAIRRADDALYDAKRGGRNRVVFGRASGDRTAVVDSGVG